MLCVSVADRSVESALRTLRGFAFAEVRLDAVEDLSDSGIRKIFGGSGRRIATLRPGGRKEADRFRLLALAVQAGAAFVDIEVEALGKAAARLIAKAKERKCGVIVSYHNPRLTPPRADLLRVRERAFAAGADIVKIACRSRGPRDNARLLGLLDDPRPTIVVALGRKGALTRVVAPKLGAPFTYASSRRGRETAAGQIPASVLRRLWKALDRA